MSFFKKLKAKLFKSSAKLEAGLEAIVDEKPEPEAQVVLKSKEMKSGDLNENIDVADQENIFKSDWSKLPLNEIGAVSYTHLTLPTILLV